MCKSKIVKPQIPVPPKTLAPLALRVQTRQIQPTYGKLVGAPRDDIQEKLVQLTLVKIL